VLRGRIFHRLLVDVIGLLVAYMRKVKSKGKKGKDILLQAMEAHRVARG
jgi:hypothetical protein